jgi:hypothetical protein
MNVMLTTRSGEYSHEYYAPEMAFINGNIQLAGQDGLAAQQLLSV